MWTINMELTIACMETLHCCTNLLPVSAWKAAVSAICISPLPWSSSCTATLDFNVLLFQMHLFLSRETPFGYNTSSALEWPSKLPTERYLCS